MPSSVPSRRDWNPPLDSGRGGQESLQYSTPHTAVGSACRPEPHGTPVVDPGRPAPADRSTNGDDTRIVAV